MNYASKIGDVHVHSKLFLKGNDQNLQSQGFKRTKSSREEYFLNFICIFSQFFAILDVA